MADVANLYAVAQETIKKGALGSLIQSVPPKTLYSMLKTRTPDEEAVKTANSRDFRIPVEVSPAGQFGMLDLNGGAVAPGNDPNIQQMYLPTKSTQLAVRFTTQEINESSSSKYAAAKVWKNNLAKASVNFVDHLDRMFHNITGTQGLKALATAVDTVGTAAGTYTYTLNYDMNTGLCQEGDPVDIFSNDLSSLKTSSITSLGNKPYISAINRTSKTISVVVQAGYTLGSNTSNTDYIAFPGVGSTPASQSGLYAYNTTTTTGSLNGLSRVTYPALITPNVPVNGALSSLHWIVLKSYMRMRNGQVNAKLMGVLNDSVAAQIIQMGIAISEYQRPATNMSVLDPIPAYDNMITFGQVPCLVDIRASRTRIDCVDPEHWGRIHAPVTGEPDFLRKMDGGMFYEGRNSSGDLVTTTQYALACTENWYTDKPSANGFLYGITVDSTYFQ